MFFHIGNAAADSYDDLLMAVRMGDIASMMATRGGYLQTVTLLLRMHADLDIKNASGATALAWAQRTENNGVADVL